MRRFQRVFSVLALLVLSSQAFASKAEEKAIRSVIDSWKKAMAAKNLDKTVSFYAADAVMMPPNKDSIKGEAGIKTEWKSMFELPNVKISIKPDKVEVASSGDMAYELGFYDISFTDNGKPVSDKGKYCVVWKKINGEWKGVVDIFNTSVPAAQ